MKYQNLLIFQMDNYFQVELGNILYRITDLISNFKRFQHLRIGSLDLNKIFVNFSKNFRIDSQSF